VLAGVVQLLAFALSFFTSESLAAGMFGFFANASSIFSCPSAVHREGATRHCEHYGSNQTAQFHRCLLVVVRQFPAAPV